MNIIARYILIIMAAAALSACSRHKSEAVVAPWGEVQTDSVPADGRFTLSDIVGNGELIVLTMSGPETYYEYHGRSLGTQYMLCERFAKKIGVSLRVELCKDTVEMITRLCRGDADLIISPLPKNYRCGGFKIRRDRSAADLKSAETELLYCGAGVDSLHVQWATSAGNTELADSLNAWFKPAMLADVRREERLMLSTKSVKRHVYAPFLNRSAGVISRYDNLFKKYAPQARFDWRLMAAQCYQESCFDPQARSWAGARGLMQIMPSTAAYLGLDMSAIHDPEANVRAAAKYLAELNGKFRGVESAEERHLFMLASYNGGYFHINDAMALARKNGKNPHRWRDVAQYVLALQSPQFYNDPVVKHGYMRGSETVDYVDKIRQRYAQYRGVPYGGASVDRQSGGPEIRRDGAEDLKSAETGSSSFSPMTPRKAKRHHRFHI